MMFKAGYAAFGKPSIFSGRQKQSLGHEGQRLHRGDATQGHRFPAPLDDLLQGTDHPLGMRREVHLDAQALAVEYATLEWVDWFNHRRLLEPIGNIPPAELEAAYYRQREEPARVA